MATLAQAVILKVRTFWYCPNCRLEDSTLEKRPHTRFHACPRLAMMQAPMLRKGVKAKVEAFEREDYEKEELVQRNADGRPIMAVKTTREDGEDVLVFAPTAVAHIS